MATADVAHENPRAAQLGYTFFDTDNDYYEPTDAFTVTKTRPCGTRERGGSPRRTGTSGSSSATGFSATSVHVRPSRRSDGQECCSRVSAARATAS